MADVMTKPGSFNMVFKNGNVLAQNRRFHI